MGVDVRWMWMLDASVPTQYGYVGVLVIRAVYRQGCVGVPIRHAGTYKDTYVCIPYPKNHFKEMRPRRRVPCCEMLLHCTLTP